MTKQEWLMKIFEANPAKELDYITILYMIMNTKKTTDPADVDQISLIETLLDLIKNEKVLTYTKKVYSNCDYRDDFIDMPVYVYLKTN